MCGFVTVYNKNQMPIDTENLQLMNGVIEHRGPDDRGLYAENHIGLGFRRLSILDIENGAQPLSNEDNDVWIVFNGEIYNYQELRAWLSELGHVFHTRSDTEVLLRLYEEVGTDSPRYLRGMFAYTVWDKKKQLLFAARDPFGIKPLYYCETPDGFLMGSEIKSFLASGRLTREVNEISLYHYLTFQYVPEPATMFKSIYKLAAGHTIVIQNDQMTICPYYEVEFIPDHSRSLSDMAEEARAVLQESVNIHRNSDVPRGAFLSSGIDSSSLAGLLHQFELTKTFSVGFDIEGYSELEAARRTADFLGTDHHEMLITSSDYLKALPSIIWHMDEPVADPSAAGLYFVSRLASQYVKVAFSGEGADEFFGGYNIYREPHSLRMFNYLPRGIRSMSGVLSDLMPSGMKGKSYLSRGSMPIEERFVGNAKIFTDKEKDTILTTSYLRTGQYTSSDFITAPLYEKAKQYDDVTKMQYIDIHTWLRGDILMKADKMSMANSLELRVPFVDTKVFEFAASIPSEYKVNTSSTKLLLREAMKDIVPPDVQHRKKLGFPVPTRVWLKNEWYEWARTLIYTADVGEWINKSAVLQLLEIHKEGRVDVSRKLWTILVFMLWHKIFIEDKYSFIDSKDHIKRIITMH